MTKAEIQQVKQRFGIIGNTEALSRAIDVAIQVAPTDLSVLITGESGVGKESFPQIIHQYSRRKHAQHIAALAAEGLAGIVRRNGKSQSFQLAHYQSGDGALLSGSGIGRNQFQQFRIHGFVFHCLPPKMSRENPRNIWNKVSFVNCP